MSNSMEYCKRSEWKSVDWAGDIFQLDLVAKEWVDLTDLVSGETPSPRRWQGFTSTSDSLYLFGGELGEDIESYYKYWTF